MPKRIHPIAQYLFWLAAMIGGYVAYAHFVVPKIEVTEGLVERKAPIREIAPSSRTDRKQKFAHLFPVDAWELQPCKILETSQGTVLFQDYQPHDDGRVEVFPFTMVIQNPSRKKSPDQDTPDIPLVLRSSQKAILQFENAVEFEGEDPGKIQRGQLNGQVSIYRPPSRDGADDFLKVLTRNVQLEKHKIYTVDDVQFEFGLNSGIGRNLDIELSHDTPLDAINTDFSKINGVRSIKLGFLKRMQLHPSSKPKDRDRLLSSQKSPMEVRCQGAFEFNFEKQVATFQDGVRVRQLDESGQSLACDSLTLLFDSKVADDPLLIKPDGEKKLAPDMELRRIIAQGTPTVLNAPDRDAQIVAHYLDYDVAMNTIVARKPDGVVMAMAGQEFVGADIEYRVRDDGAIGPLLVNGPGHLKRFKDGKGFAARWTESLTIEPDSEQRKRVTLKGESELVLDGDTSITGTDLKIWLWELASSKRVEAETLSEIPTFEEIQKTKTSWAYLPQQLVGTGNVVVQSPRLSGNTNDLHLRWPRPTQDDLRNNLEDTQANHSAWDLPTKTQLATENQIAQTQQLRSQYPQHLTRRVPQQSQQNPFERNAVQQIEVQQTPQTNTIQQVGFQQDLQPAEQNVSPMVAEAESKLEFQGDRVEGDFSGHGRDATLAKLIIEGNVWVREVIENGKPDEAMEIKGNSLYILPQPNELYRMNVAGDAIVVGKGLDLSGPEIDLDQAANRLWVTGAGKMHLSQSVENAVAEQAQAKPVDVTLQWEGGMIFDGHKIYFEDNVTSAGVQTDAENQQSRIRSLSDGLSIRLSQRVDFRGLKNADGNGIGKIEIHEMILVDHIASEKRVFTQAAELAAGTVRKPVVFEKTDLGLNEEIIAKQKLIVPHASIDILAGNMTASGPGAVMNWQLGDMQQERGPIILQASAQLGGSNEPSGAEKSFLRVNFDRVLVANQQEGRVQIDGKVRALYASLDRFDQQFDPDHSTRPAGAIKMTCEQMELAQWVPRNTTEKTSEFAAKGNAVIVGDQFRALGERIDFSERKGMLVLQGSNREAARLNFIEPQTKNQRNLSAGKILYRPDDGWTDIQNVQEATLNQNGSLFNSGN